MSVQSELNRIKSEVATQEELMEQIVTALAEKAASGLDTSSNNPAEEMDVVAGKEFFVNDEKHYGGMEKYGKWIYNPNMEIDADGDFVVNASLDKRYYFDDGVTMYTSGSAFGNAKQEDVAKGVFFTSEEGLHIEGIHECSEGLDTSSDIPATASDMVVGKEAFVNGEKVVGNVKEVKNGEYCSDGDTITQFYNDDGSYCIDYEIKEDKLMRQGSQGWGYVSQDLGNAKPSDVPKGVRFTGSGYINEEGTMTTSSYSGTTYDKAWVSSDGNLTVKGSLGYRLALIPGDNGKAYMDVTVPGEEIGDARPEDVAKGVFFTSKNGIHMEGTGLVAGGGGFVFPDGAFAPVTSFTDGKQYALVAMIDGVRRYINTTTYNDYTMNATEITIGEDAGDYVIFSSTPVLFTAVASGNGFLLQNGSNYLHGTTNNGTALRFGTTQAVWTIDASATGDFSDGKYHAKEDSNAVWLKCNDGSYDWSIKFESAGSFGYDREGRDDTYSTGFVSFILYEYVAGEGDVNPIMDTSEGNLTSSKMLEGAIGFSNGQRYEGNIKSLQAQEITPSETEQYIEAGVYLAGRITIKAVVSSPSVESGTLVRSPQKTDVQIASGYSIRITYSSTVSVSNGSVTQGTTTTLSSPSNASACDVLKGKYVKAGSTTTTSTNTAIYYIPTDATFTVSGGTTSKTVTVDKCYEIFVFGEVHEE